MIVKIGILSEDKIRTRVQAIAQGKHKPSYDEPRVWFTSLDALLRHGTRRYTRMKGRMKSIN